MKPETIHAIGFWSMMIILVSGAIFLESTGKHEAAGTCALVAFLIYLFS